MSWRFNRRDVENNKAKCLFCGEDVIEEGSAFLIQQINVKPADNTTNISYSLNGQKKFLSHHVCILKNLFQRDFPNLKVDDFYFKFLEIKRRDKKQVWAISDKVIKKGCTQEEFDLLATSIAKKLLNEV